jgi:hypothetical protein
MRCHSGNIGRAPPGTSRGSHTTAVTGNQHKVAAGLHDEANRSKSNQIKLNQIKSNQIESNALQHAHLHRRRVVGRRDVARSVVLGVEQPLLGCEPARAARYEL